MMIHSVTDFSDIFKIVKNVHKNCPVHAIVFHAVEVYKVYISAAVVFKLGQLPNILKL